MRIPGHRIVVLLGITLLMVLGCQTPPGPLLEGERTSLDSPAAERHPLLEGEACRTLENIDSLMWQQPDSAFALLQAFAVSPEADSIDESDIHYFQLLLSELLYKNDCEQTNRKDLLRAVAYYDSIAGSPGAEARGMSVGPFRCRDASHASAQTTAFLAARAHYINGVGCYERDSVVEACAEYLKTLEIMEGNFEEEELVGHKARFMAYTYNRLGDLFSEQYMMEPAITCYENALVYCRIEATSPQGIANILSRLGLQYYESGDMVKMRYYYGKALEETKGTDNLVYRDLMAGIALADYQLGIGYERSVEILRGLAGTAVDKNEKLTRYLTIGVVFAEEGIYDSAIYYLEPVLEKVEDTVSQIQAAEYLRVIYDSIGAIEKLDECLRFLAIQKQTLAAEKVSVSKLESLYQDYLHKKPLERAVKEQKKRFKRLMLIVVMIITFAIILLVAESIMHKRHQKEYKEREKRLQAEADNALEKERAARTRERVGLQQSIIQQNEKVSILEKTLTQLREENETRRDAFLKEAICQKINDSIREIHITARDGAQENIVLTTQDADALREAVLKHYEGFDTFLISKYPKIRKDDLQICHLYLLGLDERQIAVLKCKTYSAIKKRANTLASLLKIEGSLQDFLLKHPPFTSY